MGQFLDFSVLDDKSKDLAHDYVTAKIVEKDEVKSQQIIIQLAEWRPQSPTAKRVDADGFYQMWDSYMSILCRQAEHFSNSN